MAEQLNRHDPIPGSVFIRDFCVGCGDPIRISEERKHMDNVCTGCSGARNLSRGNGKRPQDDDANGGLSNAIRATEE